LESVSKTLKEKIKISLPVSSTLMELEVVMKEEDNNHT